MREVPNLVGPRCYPREPALEVVRQNLTHFLLCGRQQMYLCNGSGNFMTLKSALSLAKSTLRQSLPAAPQLRAGVTKETIAAAVVKVTRIVVVRGQIEDTDRLYRQQGSGAWRVAGVG